MEGRTNTLIRLKGRALGRAVETEGDGLLVIYKIIFYEKKQPQDFIKKTLPAQCT